MSPTITSVTGRPFRLPGNDIDTDRIIPARFLKCVTFDGLGQNVFKDDRVALAGEHPFDRPENAGCSILVVDENFGSGSSREHAVPALMQWGIKAVIGLSFAEIFRGNAVGNGLVCVELSSEDHANLVKALSPGGIGLRMISIDLQTMTIKVKPSGVGPWANGDDDLTAPCTIPAAHQEMLITGRWDQLATAMEAGDLIEATAAKLPYMAAPA